jgi:hypothetical protein
LRAVLTVMGFYLHIGPYTRLAIAQLDRQIEALENGRYVAPPLQPPVRATAGAAVAVNA